MGTAAQRQVPLVLAVVALLLGLLAMHGLASGHHAPALPADAPHAVAAQGQHEAPSTTAVLAAPAAAPALSLHDARTTRAAVAEPAGASSCKRDCDHGLAVLCLAVLSAGAAVLALLVARRTRPLPLPAPPVVILPRPGLPLRLRPPDPVRDLCISRT